MIAFTQSFAASRKISACNPRKNKKIYLPQKSYRHETHQACKPSRPWLAASLRPVRRFGYRHLHQEGLMPCRRASSGSHLTADLTSINQPNQWTKEAEAVGRGKLISQIIAIHPFRRDSLIRFLSLQATKFPKCYICLKCNSIKAIFDNICIKSSNPIIIIF